MRFDSLIYAALAAAALFSCVRGAPQGRALAQTADGAESGGVAVAASEEADGYRRRLDETLLAAGIPYDMGYRIRAADKAVFLPDLLAAQEGDPFLRRLVDKRHALPEGYEPDDLVTLGSNGSYRIGRSDLRLRRAAADALERMAQAARADGVTLTASSAYRSFDYQTEVYNRNVRISGQETADRESSRPGFSQHQLGLAVDFGSITDEFAETAAGRWIL
ncbi:MAG: M15 family metallopeptidase, partial [Spirochaetaceae bacterium]|nr:M15 family metallopeptidase [Spirochaetaceae bacterium]